MPYRVQLSKRAVKDLDRLADPMGRRVYAALQALADDPRPHGCKKLQGSPDTYRIRVGDYRALYDIDEQGQTVSVLRVQHRREAYRSL